MSRLRIFNVMLGIAIWLAALALARDGIDAAKMVATLGAGFTYDVMFSDWLALRDNRRGGH